MAMRVRTEPTNHNPILYIYWVISHSPFFS